MDKEIEKFVSNCRTVFTRFGIPHFIASDNAKEYISEELISWLNLQGCQKIECPLYSPESNGLAERAVQTIKRAIKFYSPQLRCSIETYLQKILFRYHNSSAPASR